jgi:hypothetical protein
VATSVAAQQRILAGIGFPLAADGDAGPLTRQAITWFQEAWTRTRLDVDGLWGPDTETAARACLADHGRVSDHFSLAEFACRCRWPRAHRKLVAGLEQYRTARFTQGGLVIVSGFRCAAHNIAIGGARSSQHLQGRAADVPPVGDNGRLVTVDDVARLRLFTGLEYQPKTWSGSGLHPRRRARRGRRQRPGDLRVGLRHPARRWSVAR